MYYDYGYDGLAGIFGALAGFMVIIWLVGLAITVLTIIANWKLFAKAGEPGWAAIVPFYNLYVLYKITWGNGWYSMFPIGSMILYSIFLTAGKFGAFLSFLLLVFFVVISIITCVKLAKAFGQGGGFACGLIFLNTIFICIMGFSKDIVYVGVPRKEGQYNAGYGQQGYQQQGYQNPYSQGYQAPQQPYQAPDAQQGTYQQQSTQNPDYFYQQTSTPAGPKFCPGCGTSIEGNPKYCPKCGKPL